MKLYKIKSPSGIILQILADSIFHACQIAVENEGYIYTNSQYLKLNK